VLDDIFLTEQGKQKLEQELENLKGPVRLKLAAQLKSAIEMGDLSENADYKKAKEDQGFIEGKIQELEATLKRARIIDESNISSDIVQMGSSVVIKEEGYPEETIQIVGSKEADPPSGKLSYESPIGSALLKRKVGDIVRIDTPAGKTNFKIVSIQ
jgi:transcription elongation factor GreA